MHVADILSKVHSQLWIPPSFLPQEFPRAMKVALFRLGWPQTSVRFLFSSRSESMEKIS